MSRPLRIEYEVAFYPITARKNAKRALFLTDRDSAHFLELMGRIHERYGGLIHAYVLMTTHLLMETPQGILIVTLHDLNTAYTTPTIQTRDTIAEGIFSRVAIEVLWWIGMPAFWSDSAMFISTL